MRGPAILRALQCEKLFVDDVDSRVRKVRRSKRGRKESSLVLQVLELVNRAIDSGIPFDAPEGSLDTPETRAFLRKAAASAVVLLKNDKGILPLKAGLKRIAVIGPNAKQPIISGGGSASLSSVYSVTPLEGIKAAARKIGAEVVHAPGVGALKLLPLMGSLISEMLFEFWNDPPTEDFLKPTANLTAKLPPPAWTSTVHHTYCFIDLVVRNVNFCMLGELD